MFGPRTVDEFVRRQKKGGSFEADLEQRRKVRIGVVDDEPFQPLNNLHNQGYSVAYIGNVDRADITQEYDIVLCDINGVATGLNKEEQGAALLSEIRRNYPQKYLIVYSGLSGRAKAMRLAKQRADKYIPKSVSMDIWLQELDSAIKVTLDPKSVWEKTRKTLVDSDVNAEDVARIERAYVKSLSSQKRKHMDQLKNNFEADPMVQNVISGLISSAIFRIAIGV